jgi:hypothetical protein
MIDTFLRGAEFIGRSYLVVIGVGVILLTLRAALGILWLLATRKARLKAAVWRQTRERMEEDQSNRAVVYGGFYVWIER